MLFCDQSLFNKILPFFIILLHAIVLHGNEGPLCYCKKKEVKCKDFEDFDHLKTELYLENENCKVSKLTLAYCNLPALPHGMLNGSSFSDIRIRDSFLPFLSAPIGGENPFKGGESITKLTLDGVHYPYNWDWSVMNACENLTTLRIIKSDMIYIGPLFRLLELPNLATLVIDNSRLKWIYDQAFANLEGLAFLHLINNNVKIFKRNFLPNPASNLHVINFRNNKLEFISENLFSNMPELTYVNLENNNLVAITEFAYKGAFVNLSGNPLRCDCTIEWLQRSSNFTDIYRLHCFTPEPNSQRIRVKEVNWDGMTCY